MNNDKAQYNKNEILEAIKKVKKFPLTVNKKENHKPKYWELYKLYEDLEHINKWIFWVEEYNIHEYKKTIQLYEYNTKKEMDIKLRLCKLFLLNALYDILRLDREYFIA